MIQTGNFPMDVVIFQLAIYNTKPTFNVIVFLNSYYIELETTSSISTFRQSITGECVVRESKIYVHIIQL